MDWDARTYDRISGPQQAWAAEQLQRLALTGDEIVLDAGCGSGRITAVLADRLPRGRVYGVDAAPSMVAHAQAALGDRATITCQDLVELTLPEPVDAVFSNATFHWILDHDALFAALHRALKPGGRLVAQCGGAGNIASFRTDCDEVMVQAPFARHFAGRAEPWNYATPEETERRLRSAGFSDVRCWLQPKPTTPEEPDTFARKVCLVRHLDALPAELHDPFMAAVMERVRARTGEPVVFDYVRLNLVASRAG